MHKSLACFNLAQRGFTLLELLVTIALIAIVAGLAVPALGSFIANNRAAAQTNELVGALQLARNEAVTRASSITVCAASTPAGTACAAGYGAVNWTSGWIVFVDDAGASGVIDAGDAVLRVYPELRSDATLIANTAFVPYLHDGSIWTDPGLGGASAMLQLQVPRCTQANNRNVEVTATGRPKLTHVPC